jgi:putative ABC transport system ATP-binding protein
MSEAPAAAPIIRLENVSKHYVRGRQRVEVLHALSVEVERGDFLALMGPSGSGKTTLLNLIGGLDRPSAGSVTVCGERLETLSSGALAAWRARHVGFIFQFYHLLPVLTAAKNVELPLLLTDLNAAQRARHVEAALAIVGLSDRARHKPGELSGGQQQRVAIARALVADPELIVCDEPTGDLDRDTADQVLGFLRELADLGKTIVMVTHDPKAAEFATHRLHLDKGQLVDAVSGPR